MTSERVLKSIKDELNKYETELSKERYEYYNILRERVYNYHKKYIYTIK